MKAILSLLVALLILLLSIDLVSELFVGHPWRRLGNTYGVVPPEHPDFCLRNLNAWT